MSSGFDADGVMSLASNAVDSIDIDSLPKPVARLVLKIRDSGGMGNSSQYLMHMGIAAKLMTRLVRAGILSDEQREQFLGTFIDAPAPFFDFSETSKQAEQIETGILNRLHLHKMPTGRAGRTFNRLPPRR